MTWLCDESITTRRWKKAILQPVSLKLVSDEEGNMNVQSIKAQRGAERLSRSRCSLGSDLWSEDAFVRIYRCWNPESHRRFYSITLKSLKWIFKLDVEVKLLQFLRTEGKVKRWSRFRFWRSFWFSWFSGGREEEPRLHQAGSSMSAIWLREKVAWTDGAIDGYSYIWLSNITDVQIIAIIWIFV